MSLSVAMNERLAISSVSAARQLREQLVVALLRLARIEPPQANRDVPRLGPPERLEVLRRVRRGVGLVGERAGLEAPSNFVRALMSVSVSSCAATTYWPSPRPGRSVVARGALAVELGARIGELPLRERRDRGAAADEAQVPRVRESLRQRSSSTWFSFCAKSIRGPRSANRRSLRYAM